MQSRHFPSLSLLTHNLLPFSEWKRQGESFPTKAESCSGDDLLKATEKREKVVVGGWVPSLADSACCRSLRQAQALPAVASVWEAVVCQGVNSTHPSGSKGNGSTVPGVPMT